MSPSTCPAEGEKSPSALLQKSRDLETPLQADDILTVVGKNNIDGIIDRLLLTF